MKNLKPKDTIVEQIYNGTSEYMRIVNKTMCNMIPKAINLFIIQKLEGFIEINLHIKIPDDDKHVSFFSSIDSICENISKIIYLSICSWKCLKQVTKMLKEI